MQAQAAESLLVKKCLPCEGGLEPCSLNTAQQQLAELPGWRLTHEAKRIRKDWKFKNFVSAMRFLNAVGELAAHHRVWAQDYRYCERRNEWFHRDDCDFVDSTAAGFFAPL